MKKTFHLLHAELDRIKDRLVSIDTIFFLDKETGEMIPVAESIPEEAELLIQKIKRRKSSSMKFIMMYQESSEYVSKTLSSSSAKILSLFVGKMSFDNCVYGYSYRDISRTLSMSTKTVGRAVNEMELAGIVNIHKQKGRMVYVINPAYVWKGSFYKIQDKLGGFKQQMINENSFLKARKENAEGQD